MSDLTRERVEEWLQLVGQGLHLNCDCTERLCRSLLEAWGYKAEAMAGRKLLRPRVDEALLRTWNTQDADDFRAYADARAANEGRE